MNDDILSFQTRDLLLLRTALQMARDLGLARDTEKKASYETAHVGSGFSYSTCPFKCVLCVSVHC